MDRSKLVWMAVACLAVAMVVSAALWFSQSATPMGEGRISRIRLHSVDKENTLVVVDYRMVNSSLSPIVFREARLTAVLADSTRSTASVVAEALTDRYFASVPELGAKANKSLVWRDRIEPGTVRESMVMAAFPLPLDQLEARKELKLEIVDIDGPVTALTAR
jgi:hypothetical protein